jgi:hypothetical protein
LSIENFLALLFILLQQINAGIAAGAASVDILGVARTAPYTTAWACSYAE